LREADSVKKIFAIFGTLSQNPDDKFIKTETI